MVKCYEFYIYFVTFFKNKRTTQTYIKAQSIVNSFQENDIFTNIGSFSWIHDIFLLMFFYFSGLSELPSMPVFCSLSFVYLTLSSQTSVSSPSMCPLPTVISFCTLWQCLISICTTKQITLKTLSSPDTFQHPSSAFHLPARQFQVISLLVINLLLCNILPQTQWLKQEH